MIKHLSCSSFVTPFDIIILFALSREAQGFCADAQELLNMFFYGKRYKLLPGSIEDERP
jgi:hypothetical protein